MQKNTQSCTHQLLYKQANNQINFNYTHFALFKVNSIRSIRTTAQTKFANHYINISAAFNKNANKKFGNKNSMRGYSESLHIRVNVDYITKGLV